MRNPLFRYENSFPRFGIATYPWWTPVQFKRTKATNFDAVTARQMPSHFIQNIFDDQFNIGMCDVPIFVGERSYQF